MRPNTTGLRDAVRAALSAIEDVTRLDGIRSEHRSLTDGQARDEVRAIERFNNAAAAINGSAIATSGPILAPMTAEWNGDALIKRASILSALRPYLEGQEIAEAVRARIGDQSDSGSGRAEGSRGPDEIRDMIESRERQHDFDFPTSDEIRGLPFPDANGEIRAISDFANASALFVNDFRSQVAVYARTVSPWLGLATVVTSDNGRPLIVPQLTGDVTIYTPGEGTAITPSDPTLASVTVTPTGFKALSYVSRESWEDEEVNLSNLIARSHARAIGIAFGTAFTTTVLAGITNAGTATPLGGNGTAAPTFVGYEDLIDLQYSRAAPYRLSGAWVMSNGMIKKVRKYKDQQGQYLWPSEDAVSGQPVSFMGGQVWEDPGLAAPSSATKSVVYGDASAGLLIKATPIRVETSEQFLFSTDQIAIRTVQRIAGAVQDAVALAYLVSSAT